MASISETFASHIANVEYDDLDSSYITWAKQKVADSIGVLLAGVHGSGNDAARALIKRWGGAPESSVLIFGDKVPAHNAAFLNSLMLRAYDFEAIDAMTEEKTTYPAHITGSTLPAMLAVGQRLQATGKDMLVALLLGDDLAARLISASGFDLYDCFDSNGTANCMGVTAVASKLMNMDAKQICNALSLGLNMCGGSMENVFQAAWAFKLPLALSAHNGIIAAEMAKEGLSGVADPLAGIRCYLDMFAGSRARPERLTNSIGTIFYNDVVIKPWPSCHATQYALDASLEITRGKSTRPDEIHSITIRVSPHVKGFVGQDFEFGTTNQPSGAFSLRFTVATAILRGGLLPSHYDPALMCDPELGKMLEKLSIRDDGPKKGALVEITLADGSILRNEVNESLGHSLAKPLSEEQLLAKFKENVRFSNTIELKRAERAFEYALAFEKLETLEPLIDVLTL